MLTPPTHLLWDLPAEPPPAGLLDELLGAGLLSFSLVEAGPGLRPSTAGLVAAIAAADRLVTLSVAVTAFAAAHEQLADARRCTILARVGSLTDLESARAAPAFQWQGPVRVGVSLPPTAALWPRLPELLFACIDAGVPIIEIPIQRPAADGSVAWPDDAERDRLAERLQELDRAAVQWVVHDPLLWPLLAPAGAPMGDGCQAGGRMLYIGTDLTVSGCPLLPVPFGRVGDASLAEMLAAEARSDLRQQIAAVPQACSGCPVEASCAGGCRGRALFAGLSLAERDPACKASAPW